MAKVLISAIGTGRLDPKKRQTRDYDTTEYKFLKDECTYETPFIAAALSTHLKVDKVILVGTKKSMWEGVYQYFAQNAGELFDEDFWAELGDKVENYQYGMPNKVSEDDLKRISEVIDAYLKKLRPEAEGGSRCYLMEYGVYEEELIKNFEIFMDIADNLKDGDEVYLDITHSFRSIPIFMFVMLDFVETLKYKNIKLESVYYGMYEAYKELGCSLIVDLKVLFTISKWIKATYDFINYGNGYLISELIHDEEISRIIKNISDLINLNSLKDLRSNVDKFNNLLEHKKDKIETAEHPAFGHLLPYVEDFTKRFYGISSNSEFQFRLAEWYYENKRYSSSYVCLAEAIITKVLELYINSGLNVSTTRKKDRKRAKKLIFENLIGEPKGSPLEKLHSEFDEINSIRNLIAHAGFTEDKKKKDEREKAKYEDLVKMLDKHIREVRKLLFGSDIPEEIKNLPSKMPLPKADD